MNSVKTKDILDYFEELYPLEGALEWDNVGLLIGRMDKRIKRAGLCLDITESILDCALIKNLDLIITHHPFIFTPLKTIVDNRILTDIIKNDINVISLHTNLDNSPQGTGYHLGKLMGLKNIETPGGAQAHIKTGDFESPMGLSQICDRVKDVLGGNYIRLVTGRGHGPDYVFSSMAISPGSYDESVLFHIKGDTTVVLTGDLKYHQAVDAQKAGYTIIDGGHFETEEPIMAHLGENLKLRFPRLDLVMKMDGTNPFKTI